MSKHYYIYIEAGAQVDLGSRFFRVGIGSSKQATRDYLFLLGHAVSSGFFFQMQSRETDGFLCRVAQSLSLPSLSDLHVTTVEARDLVRSIKNQTPLEAKVCAAHTSEYQRLMLNADYRLMANLRRKKASARGNNV